MIAESVVKMAVMWEKRYDIRVRVNKDAVKNLSAMQSTFDD